MVARPYSYSRQSRPYTEKNGATKRCGLLIWPAPANVSCGNKNKMVFLDRNSFSIDFSTTSAAQSSTRVQKAIARAQNKVLSQPIRLTRGIDEPQFTFPSDDDDDEEEDGTFVSRQISEFGDLVGVKVSIAEDEVDGAPPPKLGVDESYSIWLSPVTAVQKPARTALIMQLSAKTVWGALHGLETVAQVVRSDGTVPGGAELHIDDAPRYPWRGLLLDTSNHYLPVEQLLVFLDAMATVKMNVLHWHIVDSYSFPFESSSFPELSISGAWTSTLKNEVEVGTAVYNASMIDRVVEYAADRAIRVVPEFDMPGHAYSWGLSKALSSITVDCPLYANGLGHVDDVPLDPTNNLTYQVVRGVLSDAAAAFPDNYLHLGGDEVQYDCWNESRNVRRWLDDHQGSSLTDLENVFFEETVEHLGSLGKQQLVWEEVFFNDGSPDWVSSPVLLPNATIIETWTGPEYLPIATGNGYDAILAYGWYLDRQTPVDGEVAWGWLDSWAQMYQVEPEPVPSTVFNNVETNSSSARERVGRVLGGEASLWSEQVDPINAQIQAWPRAAAVAERLWSPRETTDLTNAAHRLAELRCRLLHWHNVQSAPIWSDYCSAAY